LPAVAEPTSPAATAAKKPSKEQSPVPPEMPAERDQLQPADLPILSRRRFLLGLALPALGGLVAMQPGLAMAARQPERGLVIHHQHTGEWLRTVYFADGVYLRDSLRDINRVLRDWRTDQVVDIDPKLLDIVHLVQSRLDSRAPIEVVCGYRSPQTNSMLRRRSRAVAKNSLHMRGMAIDISFAGRELAAVRRVAEALGAGGVGYYPGSGFIHLDSGPVRTWSQRGRVAAGTDGAAASSRASRRSRARFARLEGLKRKRKGG
jgi:uncharacterized protein YcbK (DUF882 family)